MPLYDFKCSSCEAVEEGWSSYENLNLPRRCECGGDIHYLPSFGRSADAQRFPPTVIQRDAAGNIRFVGSDAAPILEGFERIELKDSYHIRKFENEVNERDRVIAQEHHRNLEKFREGQLKENRRAMDEIASGGAWQRFNPDTNKIETVHGLTQRGLKFYESMKKVSEGKVHSHPEPSFFVEAFTQNASNRDDHRDAASGWIRNRK